MKHDFSKQPDGADAERYSAWLLSETCNSLKAGYGDGESTKSTIFLYVNRAYESKMPEKQLAQLFAKAVLSAGYTEQEQEALFAWLEHFGEIARGVHNGT